jgi:hypothetical protein
MDKVRGAIHDEDEARAQGVTVRIHHIDSTRGLPSRVALFHFMPIRFYVLK